MDVIKFYNDRIEFYKKQVEFTTNQIKWLGVQIKREKKEFGYTSLGRIYLKDRQREYRNRKKYQLQIAKYEKLLAKLA